MATRGRLCLGVVTLGWHVEDQPLPRPAPYAIEWYTYPNIVSRGENFVTSYHEFEVGAFGFSAVLNTVTLRLRLKFNDGKVKTEPPYFRNRCRYSTS
jgi:hypothetical protein